MCLTDKNILVVLQEHPTGISISEIARSCKINRLTTLKHLTKLKDKSIVEELNFNHTKLRVFKLKGGDTLEYK